MKGGLGRRREAKEGVEGRINRSRAMSVLLVRALLLQERLRWIPRGKTMRGVRIRLRETIR